MAIEYLCDDTSKLAQSQVKRCNRVAKLMHPVTLSKSSTSRLMLKKIYSYTKLQCFSQNTMSKSPSKGAITSPA